MKHRGNMIIASILFCALLVSCGDTAAHPAETADTAGKTDPLPVTAEAETAEAETKTPARDLSGFTLSVHHFDESYITWAKTTMEAETETGDLLNDAIFRRNTAIEERYNCTLDITAVSTIPADSIRREVMAGDSTHDVYLEYDVWVVDCMPYLFSWDDLPYVDLSAPCWNPLATDVFSVGGSHYAAAGNYSLSVISRAGGLSFNKDIYAELGFDATIYDLVERNEWTLDKYREIAHAAYADLNGSSEIDKGDRFGVGGTWKAFYNRLMLGSGITYVTKDADDYPVFAMSADSGAIGKIGRIFDLITGDPYIYSSKSKDVNSNGCLGSFEDGTLLFVTDDPNGLEKKRALDLNIGFVPCPKFDEAQERYYAPSYGAEVSILLKTLPAERLDPVGLLLQAMAEESQENLIPTYKETLVKTKYARDEESGRMLDLIFDSISFDFGQNVWQEVVGNPLIKGVFVSGNGDIMSTLAKMTDSVNSQIEKLHGNLNSAE